MKEKKVLLRIGTFGDIGIYYVSGSVFLKE